MLACLAMVSYLMVRAAVGLDWTPAAQGSFGSADACPKFHHGLIEFPRSVRVHQHVG